MRTYFPIALVLVVLGLPPATRAQAVAVCGNGATEAPELCDDGNLVDGDGCDSNCTFTGCGNTIVTAGEECDDGKKDQHQELVPERSFDQMVQHDCLLVAVAFAE